jgi:heme exporter protein B
MRAPAAKRIDDDPEALASEGRRARLAATPPGFIAASVRVFAKDVAIELRTREIVTTAGFFAALVAILASVSFYAGPETTVRVAPGAMWLAIVFSSILALGRTWQREREESALVGLLVAPIARASIFVGKALGVWAFVTAVEFVVVPVVALFFHVDLGDVIVSLSCVVGLGTIGIAAAGTLFGAMTVRTQARDLVLASVLFPLLSPTMVSGVAATREIFAMVQSMHPPGAMEQLGEVRDYMLLLGAFDVLAVLGGVAFFGPLVDD